MDSVSITYQNLIKLIKYRDGNVSSPVLTNEGLVSEISANNYILIEGSRDIENVIRKPINFVIVLVAPKSTLSSRTSDFRKLMDQVLKKAPAGRPNNIIIVSDSKLNSHLQNALNEIKKDRVDIVFEDYPYKQFAVDVPAHVKVPKHEICDPAEIEKYLLIHHITRQQLQLASPGEPMRIWLGASSGDVLKIHRVSESAGTAIAYRFCV